MYTLNIVDGDKSIIKTYHFDDEEELYDYISNIRMRREFEAMRDLLLDEDFLRSMTEEFQ